MDSTAVKTAVVLSPVQVVRKGVAPGVPSGTSIVRGQVLEPEESMVVLYAMPSGGAVPVDWTAVKTAVVSSPVHVVVNGLVTASGVAVWCTRV